MKRNRIVILVLIILLLGLFIFFLPRSIIEGMHNEIPRQIWTFWDGDVPDFVNKCVESWRHYNPDYKIRILNKDNLSFYLPDVDFTNIKHLDQPQRFSDMVRLHILAKYGGIWSDASIICNKSFDWIHETQSEKGYEFVGYYLDGFTLPEYKEKSKVIESWFFACIKESPFVQDWRDEFSKISNYDTINQYVDSVKNEGVSTQKIDVPDYLTIHVSAQKVLQKADSDKYNLYLLKAEDTAYKYLVDYKWDTESAVKEGILGEKYRDSDIMKLRGNERNYISSLDYSSYFDYN